MGATNTHHYKSLDGLRGFAALVVVLSHYINGFVPAISGVIEGAPGSISSRLNHSPLNLLIAGNLAVCVFFVLSAFVLSAKFFKTADSTKAHQAVVKSFVKRYFRLAIPVCGAVAISYYIFLIGGYHNLTVATITHSESWLGTFWPGSPSLLGAAKEGLYDVFAQGTTLYDCVLWTMKIEFLGSILLFGTLLMVGRLPQRWLFYGVLLFLFRSNYYSAFIFGIILSDIWHTRPDFIAKINVPARWALLIAGLALGTWKHGLLNPLIPNVHLPLLLEQKYDVPAHCIGALGIVAAVLLLKPLQAVLLTKPLQYLGNISFSMYLLHVIILGSFSCYLFSHLLNDFSYYTSFGLMLIPSFLIIFISSWIYARWVDRNAVVLSNRIATVLMSSDNLGIVRVLLRKAKNQLGIYSAKARTVVTSFTL